MNAMVNVIMDCVYEGLVQGIVFFVAAVNKCKSLYHDGRKLVSNPSALRRATGQETPTATPSLEKSSERCSHVVLAHATC